MAQRELVYIIIPVHNRRSITLECLEHLKQQSDLDRYHVIIVDDGSTDGTTGAIHTLYPGVAVLEGDGNLWWTGAIKKGMEYAYSQGAEFFIWLNDDTLPAPGCFSLMVAACTQQSNKLVAAQCYATSDFEQPTYGGQKKEFLSLKLFHTPLNQTIACDCMSGNLVCFPRSIVEKIGLPPHKKLPHCWADVVYTWEAKQAGYELEVLGSATAICAFNPLEEGWASSSIPMAKRWELLLSLKSNLYPSAYWNYCKSFYGSLAVIPFIQVYLRLILFTIARWIFPRPFLKQMKALKEKLLSFNSPI